MASRKYGPSVFEKMQEGNARRFEREAKRRGLTVEQYSALRSLKFWGTLLIVLILLPTLASIQSCVSA